MADAPKKGDRQFRVWYGGLGKTIWAGQMTFDGTRWVSRGQRHDVTDDVLGAAADFHERYEVTPTEEAPDAVG